jgi:hypothetical protein
MIRIYLDWQIFKYLKEPEKYAEKSVEIQQLKSLLDSYENYITLCYSPAHIKDLTNKNLDKLQDERLQSDLECINQITKGNYLFYDGEKIILLIGNSINALNTVNLDIEGLFSIDSLFGDFGDAKFDTWDFGNIDDKINLKSLIEKYNIDTHNKSIREVINLITSFLPPLIDNFSDFKLSSQIYKKFFYDTLKTGNNRDLITNYIQFLGHLHMDWLVWQNIKELPDKLGIPNNKNDWNENTIKKIETFLQTQGNSITFSKLIEPNEYVDKKYYNFFVGAFMILEELNYETDNPKKGAYNFANDITHSFYATHCNIFISEDKKLVAKSKALYEYFNINTKVLSIAEFLTEFPNNIDTVIGKNFFNQLVSHIKIENLIPHHEITNINDGRKNTNLYKLDKYFLGFFNRLEVMSMEEEDYLELTLTRNDKNYGNYLWYSEIEKLVQNFYVCFNLDDIDRGKLREFMKDKEQNSIILWTQDVKNHTNKIAIMLNKLSDANISLQVYLPYEIETKK